MDLCMSKIREAHEISTSLVDVSLIWWAGVYDELLPCFDEYTRVKPSTFACSLKPTSSHPTVRLHYPNPPLLSGLNSPVLGKTTRTGIRRAFWMIEMPHLTPHPSASHFLPGFPSLLSSRVNHVPRVCPKTPHPPPPNPSPTSSPPLTLSPSALCVSSVSSFLKNEVSSGFMLAASRGIHCNEPVHGAR